jgi:hypothetical protein
MICKQNLFCEKSGIEGKETNVLPLRPRAGRSKIELALSMKHEKAIDLDIQSG